MSEVLQHLVLLYSGVLLFNSALSAVLWYRLRTPLLRVLFAVWMAGLFAFGTQGALTETPLLMVLAFAPSFTTTLALAFLLAAALEIPIPWRVYASMSGLALALTLIAHFAGAPFWLMALPIAFANAAPILHMGVTAFVHFRRRTAKVSELTLALAVSSIFCGLHMLDFPFLRDREEFAPLGFTVALMALLALSITAPGVVLERIAADRARIQEIDRIKTQFFANISHELRTPLTVILASLEQLMQQASMSADDRRQLDIVRRNAARLLRLIDEMLDLSKIDAGGLRLNITAFSLHSLARNVCENNQPLGTSKSIELVWMGGAEPGDMHGDPHRIEIILANLIGNALKYTPKGGRIEVSVAGDELGASVSVKDTGPGIPPEDVDKVFERFFQVNRADRRAGGVGIGLALAKELAEMHEGKLMLKSEVGTGSTFSLWLPKGKDHFRSEVVERRATFGAPVALRRADDAPLPEPKKLPPIPDESLSTDISFSGRRPRILVVEDQDDLRDFTVRLFAGAYEVVQASDGEEGWERVNKDRPDLVVSDVMMPNRSGTDLCRAIKSDPSLRTTPVILLTARVGSEATLEAYAHGADDFVPKPFHPQVLLARVRAQLQIRSLSLQLTSSEKLAAVGTLAAGVAHEVKNPLNFIINATSVLLESNDPELVKELLPVIADGARRIDGIVSALSTHARPNDANAGPSKCDLKEGLEATLRLLQHRMRNVEIEREYRTELKAFAPVGQVNQVLMNLLDNAVRTGASKIWIRLLSNEDRVRVQVADNGPGVPDDIAERIFDPFFTTRAPGEGTGLGLYLSRKIATDCGGSLTLKRRNAGGAEFQLELPQDQA